MIIPPLYHFNHIIEITISLLIPGYILPHYVLPPNLRTLHWIRLSGVLPHLRLQDSFHMYDLIISYIYTLFTLPI